MFLEVTVCSDEIRAAAIAELLCGHGISEVAKKYQIGKATVHRLAQKLRSDGKVLPPPERHVPRAPELDARFASIDDLVELALGDMLRAIADIAKAASSESYIRTQPASQVAQLVGTLSNETFSILTAFENARASEPGRPAATGSDPAPEPEVVPS